MASPDAPVESITNFGLARRLPLQGATRALDLWAIPAISLMRPPNDHHSRPVLVALFVVFLWATSWVLIKIGLADIPALTFAGLRYTLAFLCLLPFAVPRLRTASRPLSSPRVLIKLLALGFLLYTITQGAVFVALSYLEAVTVNLLWSFSTVFVALLGMVTLAEHPSRFQWAGIIIALLGAIVYFGPHGSEGGRAIGIAISAIGVLANAGAVILGRDINRAGDLHPTTVTTVSMGVGSIALLAIGVGLQGIPQIPPSGWAIVLWLAIVNTAIAFTLWNYTLRTLSAAESSVINGTMTIWIPILAVVFLGETISGRELAGLAGVALGTLIVQTRSPSPFRGRLQSRRRT